MEKSKTSNRTLDKRWTYPITVGFIISISCPTSTAPAAYDTEPRPLDKPKLIYCPAFK